MLIASKYNYWYHSVTQQVKLLATLCDAASKIIDNIQ